MPSSIKNSLMTLHHYSFTSPGRLPLFFFFYLLWKTGAAAERKHVFPSGCRDALQVYDYSVSTPIKRLQGFSDVALIDLSWRGKWKTVRAAITKRCTGESGNRNFNVAGVEKATVVVGGGRYETHFIMWFLIEFFMGKLRPAGWSEPHAEPEGWWGEKRKQPWFPFWVNLISLNVPPSHKSEVQQVPHHLVWPSLCRSTSINIHLCLMSNCVQHLQVFLVWFGPVFTCG